MHIDEFSYHIIEFVFTIIELLSFYAFKISNLIFYVNLGRMFIVYLILLFHLHFSADQYAHTDHVSHYIQTLMLI